MLYHFLFPLADQSILFNVFQYISFRAAGAMVTALLTSFVIGPVVIGWLTEKNWGQVVRAEGPATHLRKAGTPTMGGLIILAACLIPTLLWARLDTDTPYVWIAFGVTAWMGAIGFMDDYLKIVRKESRGLIARYKLIWQFVLGLALGVFLLWQPLSQYQATETMLPFFKDLSIVFVPAVFPLFVAIVVAGSANTVNLTDGLDGLATGLAAIAALTFGIFAYAIGRVDTSTYLGVFYLSGAGELAVFCAALSGAAIGFLWFNAPPAQVFMGDTGSLALGGAIGAVAVLLKSEFLLLIVGGVFVLEGVSVMLQTSWFKFTRWRTGEGRRVFRMAPLHHHFEKLGWPETRVVMRFYILGIIFALVGLATLKVR
ncbi:MAG: phospho-N-acetylmuramoyl-pentapeptide-transferase [Gemmatimonadetes bacterium]|nr:phospho-N-acetylmuramoyl-pentapeptide-transferase [Gemmatimonadota bacterium]